jgi:hypothetical protein
VTAFLVSREQAVATTLVVSLLPLVRGYSMRHRSPPHGKAKNGVETTPREGKGVLDGPERSDQVRGRNMSGHNEKPSRTLEHISIVPTHHQNCKPSSFFRVSSCHEGAMLAEGIVLYSTRVRVVQPVDGVTGASLRGCETA